MNMNELVARESRFVIQVRPTASTPTSESQTSLEKTKWRNRQAYLLPVGDFSKYDVLVIEPRSCRCCDEKLATISTGSCIGHGEQSCTKPATVTKKRIS